MKYILLILTALIGIGGIISDQRFQKLNGKSINPYGVWFITAIATFCVFAIIAQRKDDKDAELKHQQVVSELEEAKRQHIETLNEITGGDSYVQVKYLPLDNFADPAYPNGRRFEIDFTLYNKFNYPVSDIRGQLTEFDSTGKIVKVDSFIIGEALNPSADTSNSQALYLSASNTVHFPKRAIAKHENELYFEFNIVQRNREEITQQIILKKVAADNDMSPKYARIWVSAHRVYSKKQKKFVDEWSDKPFFPTGSDGNIDWSVIGGIK